jgi:uncharacterized membrane protein YgcG
MRRARALRRNQIAGRGVPALIGVPFALALTVLAVVGGPVTLAQASTTTFGGNPALAANAKGPHGEPLTCSPDRPEADGPGHFVAAGASSCAWWWTGGTAGRDSPFGASGGSGTVTSVTLPAMAKPGPMKVVIFSARDYIPDERGAVPDFLCCEVAALSQEFTPPANQEFTEPVDLPISSQPIATQPGDASIQEIAGISMLSGTESMPVAELPSEPERIDNADYLYYPSPSGPGSTCTASCPSLGELPVTTVGYEMLAQFTLEPTSSSTGGGSTGGGSTGGGSTGGGSTGGGSTTTTSTPPLVTPLTPPSPIGGLNLTSGSVGVPTSGKVIDLGTASNPPTASTTQTITGVLPVAHSSAVAASKKKTAKEPKAVVLGSGSTTVTAGKTATIAIKLTSAASAALKSGKSLTGTEKITATGPTGLTATTTKTIVLKPTRSKSKKSH